MRAHASILRATALGVPALLALIPFGSSCDERFDFDVAASVRGDAGTPHLQSGCNRDVDCGLDSLFCDTESSSCAECVVDDDCQSHAFQRCERTLHRCVECQIQRDCAAGLICDTTTHRCMRSCLDEPDCAPADHGCDERRGVCIQCDRDTECAPSPSTPFCAFDGTGCVQCRVDSHCSQGMVCDPVFGRCAGCRSTSDCAGGLVCDPFDYGCVAAPGVTR